MKSCVLFAFIVLAQGMLFASQNDVKSYIQESKKPGANYFTIVAAERARLRALNLTNRDNRKALKQFERWAYQWKNAINPDGTFPARLQEFALLNLRPNTPLANNASATVAASDTWEQIGPQKSVFANGYTAYPGMGRVNCVRKLDASTYIVATPNGGIWKTTDGGAHWQPKTDMLARIGVSDIQVHKTNPSIIYAITGDRDNQHCASIGVIKSTDAGETWATTGVVIDPSKADASAPVSVTNLAVDPDNADHLVVNINGTTILSTNGGAEWKLNSTPLPGANDLLWVKNNNGNALYLSDILGKIHKSTDGGNTFTEVYASGVSKETVLRFNQALVGDDVYFFMAAKDSGIVFKFAHTASTEAVTPTQVGERLTSYNPQETYDIAFSVNPTNSQEMMAFGVDGYFSNDGAASWSKKIDAYTSKESGESYVHPDHHFAAYLDATTLLLTHDGGVGIITTNTKPFGHQDITGNLIISQIYHTAIVNSEDNNQNVLMGLQDNDGFSKSPSAHSGVWVAAAAGDGTATAINYNDPKIRYLGGTEGSLSRTATAYAGGYDDMKEVKTPKENAPFVWELLMHDTNPTHLFGGFGELYYTTNEGESWENAGMGVGQVIDIEQRGNRIAAVGTSSQKIAEYSPTQGISNIATINPPEGDSLLFNSFSLGAENTLYASMSAYRDGKKIFKSTDNGSTWQNISGNLPNLIVNKVVAKVTALGTYDEILFAATNVGVYVKEGSNSTEWKKLGTNLPFTSVSDIDINYTTDKLIASTFGRGIWQIDIKQGTTGVADLTPKENTISIAPNPVEHNGKLSVTLPTQQKPLAYAIYNCIGGKIASGTVSEQYATIPLADVSAGSYLLVFSEGNNKTVSTHRIVVQK